MEPSQSKPRHSGHSMEGLKELANQLETLAKDLECVGSFFDHANQILMQALVEDLESDILAIMHQALHPLIDEIEFAVALQLIEDLGPTSFVKKMLWSEDHQDLAWIISLERMLPSLERLVERYPLVLMDDARSVFLAIRTRNVSL